MLKKKMLEIKIAPETAFNVMPLAVYDDPTVASAKRKQISGFLNYHHFDGVMQSLGKRRKS